MFVFLNIPVEKLLQFRDENKETLGNAVRATQQSVDRVKNNLNWMRQNYQKVVDWLQSVY